MTTIPLAVYQCPECGFQYNEALGNKHEGLPPGTAWQSLPEDYACPSCAVRVRDDFLRLSDGDSLT